MFPNSYNVYIHDTPSKELFSQTDRAFSSGCIRIKNPIKFAEYLLKDETNWNENKLQAVLKAGIEKSIVLSKPVNVHILYLTAWSKNGKIHFRNDLYERDQPVLAALKASPPSL
jgi:murein L,D-transpeptidase YcbB/YkuD